MRSTFILAGCAALALAACGQQSADKAAAPEPAAPAPASQEAPASPIDPYAEQFVRIGLALGQHDANYVDAYHGPKEWADVAKANVEPLPGILQAARGLSADLDELSPPDGEAQRLAVLKRNVRAMITRVKELEGQKIDFDAESAAIYDTVAPKYDLADFDKTLAEVDALIPGDGPLNERVDAFRNSLAIPKDRMQAVFDAAISECRKRTLAHFDLPKTEEFDMSFVTDKPWSGYNYYQGNYKSLIQVNTDLPIVIDRAVDLGCHEGYPGHHVWNIFVERDLLKKKHWMEYSLSPLFSPLGLIGEGSANYGIELAFPGEEKIAFERDVLFPLAGLPQDKAETLGKLDALQQKLSHAGNYAARKYLDGEIDREAAVQLLMKYQLWTRPRAEQRVDFIETYRAYVINYNVGLDLIRAWVEKHGDTPESHWEAFGELLRTPMTASDLK